MKKMDEQHAIGRSEIVDFEMQLNNQMKRYSITFQLEIIWNIRSIKKLFRTFNTAQAWFRYHNFRLEIYFRQNIDGRKYLPRQSDIRDLFNQWLERDGKKVIHRYGMGIPEYNILAFRTSWL